MAPVTRSALKRNLQGNFKLQKNSRRTSTAIAEISNYSTNNSRAQYGVRGLINLGGSCYINSVIQAFMHTPLLRKYFLSESHKCGDGNSDTCQMCLLSKIFKEYYSGIIVPPMSLHRLLYMVWLEAPSLAGHVQQDAHEFYIRYIQLLRDSCVRSYGDMALYSSTDRAQSSTLCNCIIDQLYAGVLQSYLTCMKCGKVTSVKLENFHDISLDLNPANEMETLYDCLENYVKSERLGESSKIHCPHCASNQEFAKTLSLFALPKVLNINFKRFVQKGRRQQKLSKHVIFPFELDMNAFARMEYSEKINDEIYSLAAVISHDGSMDSGHYTAYVRQSEDNWLLCNDHTIGVVSPGIVLDVEAYILVYQKKTFKL